MIRFMGGPFTVVAGRGAAWFVRLARAAWRSRWGAARRDDLAADRLAGECSLSEADRATLRCIVPKHRDRFCRAVETSRRVSAGTRLDRAEFARLVSRSHREAGELGARFAAAGGSFDEWSDARRQFDEWASAAAEPAPVAPDESGVRSVDRAATAAAAASAESSAASEVTPVFLLDARAMIGPDARDARG